MWWIALNSFFNIISIHIVRTELWNYLKEVVTHDTVGTVDELVEKLVTTVNTIPQPYLRSVVKDSMKKQKSIEEGNYY